MSELVPDHVLRALHYIAILNREGVEPQAASIDAFAVTPQPVKVLKFFAIDGFGDKIKPLPVVGYMTKLGWTEEGRRAGSLRLTALGLTVHNGVHDSAFESGNAVDTTVVDMSMALLDPDDPDMLEHFTRPIAMAGEGILIDPYFKATTMSWLLKATKITKVLMSTKGGNHKNERGVIATRLSAPDAIGLLEVRETDAPELHDRAIVADQGDVLWLGTSINGIGKHLSLLVTLPKETWPIYSHRVKQLWDSATPITATPINP